MISWDHKKYFICINESGEVNDIIKSVLLVSHFHYQRSMGTNNIRNSYDWAEMEFPMLIDELESKGWDISAVFFHDKGIRWKINDLS